MDFIDCIIIRHRKENLKKCSLRGLENRSGIQWYTYPNHLKNREFSDVDRYRFNYEKSDLLSDSSGCLGMYPNCEKINFEGGLLLDVEGELLTERDTAPLILLDATWRYAMKMREGIPALHGVSRRRIPDSFKTAYPRKQTECVDPERGLASIEALFVAFSITGRSTEGLFDNYYWKDEFLKKNMNILSFE